jgi:3-oxoacyl-[acyl-carrier-protein] synthase-3
VVGADALSKITDWEDRSTAILFGDAGAAVVLEASEQDSLLAWELSSEGSGRNLLYADVGSTMKMDGQEVFRRAVRIIVSSAEATLAKAGVGVGDVALMVPHQANQRIMDAACRRLGLPDERVMSTLATTGNTSAASIPYALAEAADGGRLRPGDLVLLVGFGAGMTGASAVLRWDPPAA